MGRKRAPKRSRARDSDEDQVSMALPSPLHVTLQVAEYHRHLFTETDLNNEAVGEILSSPPMLELVERNICQDNVQDWSGTFKNIGIALPGGEGVIYTAALVSVLRTPPL